MSFLAMKFGGTSVGSAECIRRAADLVRTSAKDNRVVVVVSAMGGVTDQIVAALQQAKSGSQEGFTAICESLRERHRAAVHDLFPPKSRSASEGAVHDVIDRLANICAGVAKVKVLPPQIADMALSLGEEMSARMLAGHLQENGVGAEYIDSARCLVTDAKYGEANPDVEATTKAARALLLPIVEQGKVPVITGYRGATSSGLLTTVGRGGSDYSATLLGAVLGVNEIWIWTDVDGVLSTDPRVCPHAVILDEITFGEAVELSHYGAKVIHQRAIQPARDAAIPVWIKNSFRPEVRGTRIAATATNGASPVKAVSAVPRCSLVTLGARQAVQPAEIFGRMFMRLAAEHVDLLFSAQSAQHALMLAVREPDEKHVMDSLKKLFRTELRHGVLEPIDVKRNVAVIAVLGEAMRGKPGILARLFSVVAERHISVIAAAQGASEFSICFAVPSEEATKVVQAVHDELCMPTTRIPVGAAAAAASHRQEARN